LIQFFKLYKLRILLHIGWCIFCILMIIGFILSSIMVPVGVVSLEACETIYNFINN